MNNMGSFGSLSDQQETKKPFAVALAVGGGGAMASPPPPPPAAAAFMASSNKGNKSVQLALDQNQHQAAAAAAAAALQIHQTHHQPLHQHHHHHRSHQHHHPHQSQQQQQQPPNITQISFGMMQSSAAASSSVHPTSFVAKDTGAYDLGDLDHALFLYLDGQEPSSTNIQEQRQNSGMRPPTLNIFPSQPMHVDPSSSASAKAISSGLVSNSPSSSGSKRSSGPSMEISRPRVDVASVPEMKAVKREANLKAPTNSSSEQEGPKTPDPKTLRRLAQNREAARKSRLRKKAYVQQLETSRMKLTQLEQEIQRARAQGIFFGGSALLGGDPNAPNPMGSMSSDAAAFDMEYSRWLEEHHRIVLELRNALQDHMPENELKLYVDSCVAHYDELTHLKSIIAKSDVFHLVSGMWKTPAERCFMWMGGFRPSELIKVIMHQIEPLTEQQLVNICGLQQSTHEAEEALAHGLETLNQSLSEIIVSEALSCPTNMGNYMNQMAVAMGKLSTVEGFVRQADSLRHQTLNRLHELLTVRQAARCFLAIAEYFHRLRALSSLWNTRPKQE